MFFMFFRESGSPYIDELHKLIIFILYGKCLAMAILYTK